MNKRLISLLFTGLILFLLGYGVVTAQTDTSFNYLGYLEEDGDPITESCDFDFSLFSVIDGGTFIADMAPITDVVVDRGVFFVTLDFGDVFSGQTRWLETAVRCPAGVGGYTLLSPRVPLRYPIEGLLPDVYPDGFGRVGINEDNPVYTLDVTGSIRTTSTFYKTNAGSTKVSISTINSTAGRIQSFGENGNVNFRVSTAQGNNNLGWMAVYDANGSSQAGAYVNSSGNGIIFGDTKNFRMANPYEPETEIWYASLEGPEAAAYIRGTAQLVDGRATIEFPSHFLAVASPAGLTVQVTPLSANSKGLAVIDKSLDGIRVQELNGGTGTYDFDFFITAVRQGYEDYQVIRSSSYLDPETVDSGPENGTGE